MGIAVIVVHSWELLGFVGLVVLLYTKGVDPKMT